MADSRLCDRRACLTESKHSSTFFDLQKEVSEIHQELGDSTETALAKGEALVKVRRTQCNIKAAIEALSVCLPVLDMYSKLTEQMNAKRYPIRFNLVLHSFPGAMERGDRLPQSIHGR